MKSERVPYFKPYISPADKKAVSRALSSRWLTGGPRAAEFERKFAAYTGTRYAVAVNSCTAALHLSLAAAGISKGDEVIVPTFTFAATANAVLYCGATPVFTDIDEATGNIAPEDIVKKITSATKAIIVVHYAGQPCDMGRILQIAQDHKIQVIEDCAHSLGAAWGDRQTGSLGRAGCFSFYPTKNITTLEGGMVTTDDEELARKIALLRNHGMTAGPQARNKTSTWYYDIVELGFNYRLNEIQATLGISQLARIDVMNRDRMEKALTYSGELAKTRGITVPVQAEDRTHVYHLYVIRVDKDQYGMSRDQLFVALAERGIGASVHYTPLHQLSYYKNAGIASGRFPAADRLGNECLSLPCYNKLPQRDLRYVIQSIRGLGRTRD